MQNPFFSAILLLAGQGQRLGEEIPKQFRKLGSKELFLYSLETFIFSGFFQEIILVVPAPYLPWVEEKVQGLSPLLKIVIGGETRQSSSFQGLQATHAASKYVVIHDAARPFVSKNLLEKHITYLPKYLALDTCIPCKDTIVFSDPELSFLEDIPTRKRCFQGQTPQSFCKDLLQKGHYQAQKEGITCASDDCQLVVALKEKVGILLGEEINFKITTPLDWDFASFLVKKASASFKVKEAKN